MELADLSVNLNPIARGNREGARDVLRSEDVAQQLVDRITADRGMLEYRDRGAAVAQPDDQDTHGAVTFQLPMTRPDAVIPLIA